MNAFNQWLKVKSIKLFEKLEVIWEKHSKILCFSLGVITGVLYYFGIIQNIRHITGDIVTFASIVIGVMGVFLTLIVTLQESPAFERLRIVFPNIQTKLYKSLQYQIYYGLVIVILSIIINSLPKSPSRMLSAIGVVIWFSFFWLLSFGAFYSVKLIIDLVVRNVNVPKRNIRK